MISVVEVISVHKILIDKYGLMPGIRDKNLLESAVLRSQQTFGEYLSQKAL